MFEDLIDDSYIIGCLFEVCLDFRDSLNISVAKRSWVRVVLCCLFSRHSIKVKLDILINDKEEESSSFTILTS